MIKQEVEKTVVQLGKKTLILEIRDFGSSEINVEDLLQIDMNNILLDLITFPVIFNRIANIKADIDALLREAKLDLTLFEAQQYETKKAALIKSAEKATEGAIDNAIKRDPQYKIKSLSVINVQKNADIIDGLYWSAKSKDQKLNAISAKIKPEEFEGEILEGTINSVLIKSQKTNFPTGRLK